MNSIFHGESNTKIKNVQWSLVLYKERVNCFTVNIFFFYEISVICISLHNNRQFIGVKAYIFR